MPGMIPEQPLTDRPRNPKLPIRRRTGTTTLSGSQLQQTLTVELPNGVVVNGQPSDWVVTRGAQIIDVCSPTVFEQAYERVDGARLALSPGACAQLDALLGAGATQTEGDLVFAVRRLATAHIGEVAVTFTPGQWDVLQHRANKQGLTLDALMHRIVARVTDDIFEGRS